MSKVLTTDKLISSVKRRAFIPSSQSTFTNEDFLEILNEEIDTTLMPFVLEKHEEYLVYTVELSKTDNNRYEIPYRAIGNKLRDVCLVDSSGFIRELSRISLEEITDFQSTRTPSYSSTFYVENSEIVILDSSMGNTDKVRMYFYMRPSALVLAERTGKITSIDRTTGAIALDIFPSGFTSLPLVDFVGVKNPNKIKGYDIVLSSVNAAAKTIYVSPASIPSSLAVGDYTCYAEESPVPQIPLELHPLLAQKAAVYCLESLGDTEGLTNAQRKLERMEMALGNVIDDRVEGAPQKIYNRNSPLRESTQSNKNRRSY